MWNSSPKDTVLINVLLFHALGFIFTSLYLIGSISTNTPERGSTLISESLGLPMDELRTTNWGSYKSSLKFIVSFFCDSLINSEFSYTSSSISNGFMCSMKSWYDIQLSKPFGPSAQRVANAKSDFTTEFWTVTTYNDEKLGVIAHIFRSSSC